MDDDWITEKAALAWLMQTYQLPQGPAETALKAAFDTGNIRCWDELIEVVDGKPALIPPLLSALVPDCFVHGLRLNKPDLQWQIKLQLGQVPRGGPTEPEPEPAAEEQRWLHDHEAFNRYCAYRENYREKFGRYPKRGLEREWANDQNIRGLVRKIEEFRRRLKGGCTN